jgi:hypothetical protein
MAGGSDSYVQVQPDAGGRKVKTLQLEQVSSTGSVISSEMQIVGLSDANGCIMNTLLSEETGMKILQELYRIRKGIALLVGDPLLDIDE